MVSLDRTRSSGQNLGAGFIAIAITLLLRNNENGLASWREAA